MKYYCNKCDKFVIDPNIERCPDCGNVYELIWDHINKFEIQKSILETRALSHWKYHDLMPINYHNTRRIISLNEGGTPLIEQNRLKHKNIDRLFFKMEGQNPTGSFKDRASALEITSALRGNIDTVIVASTGNMGASIATYAAYAGLKCIVILTHGADNIKVKQMLAVGADVRYIEGTYTDAMIMAEQIYLKNKNTMYLAGDYSMRVEGTKTIGYEIWEQLNYEVPDYIIVPVGNGTLLWAIYKAFKDLNGIFDTRMPKIIGVKPEDALTTKIGAVACPTPNADHIINNIMEEIFSLPDDEIFEAKDEMCRAGLFVEAAGAMAYACLKCIDYTLNGIVVCIATGHGLKEIDNFK